MLVLVEKNAQLSQELEECKAQMKANVAEQEESKKASSGNNFLLPVCLFGMFYKSEKTFGRQSRRKSEDCGR